MAKRKKFKVRKPRIRITSRGVKVTKPTARIGGKAGVNVSSKGVSASYRTKAGTVSTRRGCTLNPFRCLGCCSIYPVLALLTTASLYRSAKRQESN